jgi:hypothetical protein
VDPQRDNPFWIAALRIEIESLWSGQDDSADLG